MAGHLRDWDGLTWVESSVWKQICVEMAEKWVGTEVGLTFHNDHNDHVCYSRAVGKGGRPGCGRECPQGK